MIGVYCLRHKGEIVYIGSSARDIMDRKTYHLREIKNKIHKNKFLRSLDHVEFAILEITSARNCRERETYYLQLHKPIANKQKRASGHLKIVSSSFKNGAKKRWSKRSERKKASISGIKKWKNMSPDMKNKNIEILKNNREKNKHLYVNHCKTKLANMKKKKIIRDDGMIFNSIKEAAEYTNIRPNAISNCLNERCIKSGGYKWEYAHK